VSIDAAPPRAADLPDQVRTRLVALVAASLPDVVRLPAALKRVADFTPARRAKVGATAILQSLDADDELRERVATQVADRTNRRSATTGDPDPAEAAALTWLTRPEGWPDTLAAQVAAMTVEPEVTGVGAEELDRLRDRLAQAEQATRDLRAAHKAQLDELKADVTALRRKLGEERAAARGAGDAAKAAYDEAEAARVRAEDLLATSDKELRKLRSQLARAGDSAGAERRAVRSERDEATVRARLLLDTIIDSASGLRRELALPPVTGSPGDRLEAELADEGTRQPSSAGSLDAADPALLDQHLALPRARLLVDGYNVSKLAWPDSSLEVQRDRLLRGLAGLVARTRVETTVVFDAAATTARPVVNSPRGVKVLFSPPGVIADDVIRDLVAAEPAGRVVVVVTNDRAVLTDVSQAGARTAGSRALAALLSS
jgi:predicted RNA-binding protein with PIN domain